MRISSERLRKLATSRGFRAENVEKVVHLVGLLNAILKDPFLASKLALKGGTALNFFVFDLTRLSVDIDLNYIGAADLEVMKADRPEVVARLARACESEGLKVERVPDEHAGGKWQLTRKSVLTGVGTLEMDINFLLRTPLWPVRKADSASLGSYSVKGMPVLDIHELAAGKLAALLSRSASRDIYDAYQLLEMKSLDRDKLRLAFVVYGAMSRKDWRWVTPQDVKVDLKELNDRLLPMLNDTQRPEAKNLTKWTKGIVDACRKGLAAVLPLSKRELRFLDRILDDGVVEGALLTDDPALAARITSHPALEWKAVNVREHRKKT